MKSFFQIILLFFLFIFIPLHSFGGEIKGITQPVKKVNYDLPFPGILPDHPLYFLKKIRDKIVEYLKFDPQEKANFILLLSDKKIGMARELSNKGKFKLAIKTALEAEFDFKRLLIFIQKNKKLKDNPSFTSKIKLAYEKHLEVIYDIVAKSQFDEKSEAVKEVYKVLEENKNLLKKI